MSSTFFFIGRLAPKECCLKLYIQEALLPDGMVLDILRDGLGVTWVGDANLLERARRHADTVVAAHSFYHPDWLTLTLTHLNWVEAQGVEATGRITGFIDPALAMLDVHPEVNVKHPDNKPFWKAAELVKKDIPLLPLAIHDWYRAMQAYWSRDERQRLEALFHAYRAVETLTLTGADKRAFKSWGDDYFVPKVRHGQLNEALKKLKKRDSKWAEEPRSALREALDKEGGPKHMLTQFLKAQSLPH